MNYRNFMGSWKRLGATASVLTLITGFISPILFQIVANPSYSDSSMIIAPERLTVALWFVILHVIIAILTFLISRKFLNATSTAFDKSDPVIPKNFKILALVLYIISGIIAGLYTLAAVLLLLVFFA